MLKKHLKGLHRFLTQGDTQITAREVKKNPQYFEQLYPYAIALGIDKTWVERMKESDIPTPRWYGYENEEHNRANFNLKNFSQEFDIPEIKSAFTSVPPRSTGGSRGSGSRSGAGGGFGGGGGAW